MERDKIIENLHNDRVNVKETKQMLEQFKERNNNFLIELLLHLKNNNLDQMEQILDDERQFRTTVTDILIELDGRDQFFSQLCRYISIWNLFHKILEVEDEKERINREIQTIITRTPVARRVLSYLYDNPRNNCLNISKEVRYDQSIIADILDLFCEKDIVYKLSIGDKAVYDLTEQGRIWVDKHIGNYKTDIVSVKKHQYTTVMQQKYRTLQNSSAKYIELDVWERFNFGRNSKLYGIVYDGKEIDKVERKEVAEMFDCTVRYR